MNKITVSCLAIACVVQPSISATAADSLLNDSEIIVEGTRLPSPLHETGTSISIITAEDIELRGYAFALDAIASASGVTVNQNGPLGGLASVRIRGAASEQTLVLIDGVPFGDPTSVGGGYDFSILDPADIERIEILKGAQSTLWGSDAIGGVVNITTKRPQEGLGANLFVEGGSFETFRGGAAVSGGNTRGDFRLSASGIASDGISKADEADGNPERDAYESISLSARGGLNLPHNIRAEAVVHHMDNETEIDGFPPPSFFILADTDDQTATTQTSGAITLRAPMLEGKLSHDVLVGYTEIERRGSFGGFETTDNGDRLILRYQGTASIADQARLAFGAEREETTANGDDTSINGYFALLEVKPVSGVTLSGGIRHDDHSTFGGETTFRAAAAWNLTNGLSLHGSWGQGFKAPTIFQLTQSFGALPANGDLQPESSDAFDLGLEYALIPEKIAVSITYFNRDTENQIIFAPNFRYENLEETTAQGIETAVEIAVTDTLSLSANHAYIDATDVVTGERQIRIPRYSGDLALVYKGRNGATGAITVRHNGAETDGAFGDDVEAWTRVDLSASYPLRQALTVYGRVENLFDADYQQVSGFGTPGISAYGGIRLSF